MSKMQKEAGEPCALVKYFTRAKHLESQLQFVGTTIAEDELCLSVLSGLPEEYETLSTVLSSSDKDPCRRASGIGLLIVENMSSKPVSRGMPYKAWK